MLSWRDFLSSSIGKSRENIRIFTRSVLESSDSTETFGALTFLRSSTLLVTIPFREISRVTFDPISPRIIPTTSSMRRSLESVWSLTFLMMSHLMIPDSHADHHSIVLVTTQSAPTFSIVIPTQTMLLERLELSSLASSGG